jgi:hypothetical protein
MDGEMIQLRFRLDLAGSPSDVPSADRFLMQVLREQSSSEAARSAAALWIEVYDAARENGATPAAAGRRARLTTSNILTELPVAA